MRGMILAFGLMVGAIALMITAMIFDIPMLIFFAVIMILVAAMFGFSLQSEIPEEPERRQRNEELLAEDDETL